MSPFSREDTDGTLTDHLVSEEHLVEEVHLTQAERTVILSQLSLRDGIPVIPALKQNAVTNFLTTEGDNGLKSADSQRQAMLKVLFNKMLDEKLNFLKLEDHLLRKIEEEMSSRPQVENVETLPDNGLRYGLVMMMLSSRRMV